MKRSTEIVKYFKDVNGTYELKDRVGGGSFGDVFIGLDKDSGRKVAIKFEKKSQYVYQTLPKEAKVMTIMKGIHGFAKLETIVSEHSYNILIMNLLGPNLEKLFRHLNSNFFFSLLLFFG